MKLQLLFFALLLSTAGIAQDFFLKKKIADGHYNNYDFYKAMPMYEQLVKTNPTNFEVWEKLSIIYDHVNDSRNAERCYAALMGQKEVKPDHLLHYAQALSRNGKYDQAGIYYGKYAGAVPKDSRGEAFRSAYQKIESFYRDSAAFSIKKAPFSASSDDFSPAYLGESIIFASDRVSFSMVRKKYNWTNSPYLDLYEAKANSADAHPFSKELNSDYHEGPVTFNKNQDTIIFTRSNYFESHLRKSSEGINKLSLFMANWDNLQKKWVNIHPLSLNNDQYSLEHPALSEDGKSLYFASDKPGGFGGMDLYVSREITDANGAKTWGEAVNLGSLINSPGDDAFPFVDKQGNLWFASNGIPGLGGLDIFFAGKKDNGFAAAINPGYPMNTRFDDFGYITNGEGENGYLSSNRNNNYHDDDIYSVTREFRKVPILVYDARTKRVLPSVKLDIQEEGSLPRMIDNLQAAPMVMAFNPFRSYQIGANSAKYKAGKVDLTRDQLRTMDTVRIPLVKEGTSFVLDGRVFTANDNEPVGAAVVLLTPRSATTGEELKSNNLGLFRVELQPETDYQVKIINPASKVDCSEAHYEISTKGAQKDSAFYLSVPLYCKGDVIQMESIYYDLNKYNIRPDAAKVLDKLLELLNKYPKMQIELRSHTDSRASAEYNLSLSDNRAKAAAEYLYAKGIARERIRGKGYGESLLTNKCVDCSEAEHQANRRTEFEILKMD